MSSLIDRCWIWFCRLAVRVFYRQVEVVGAERLPERGAVIVCANHTNALVDVAVLQSFAPRVLHPLARSGLFHGPLRPVLAAIRAVPIHRREDPDADPGKNVGSFDRCFELLARGGALVLFPEGVSHSEPRLQPLKTGAARIALGSGLGSGLADGPFPRIVPVGLTFVEKGRFRSRVLVQVGEPFDSEPEDRSSLVEAGGALAAEPVVELTARIDGAIRALTLNAESWEELRLLRQLERFLHFRRGRLPGSKSMASRFRVLRRFNDRYLHLQQVAPRELAKLRRELIWFERLRRLYGIEDYSLSVEATWSALVRRTLPRLAVMLLLLPLAAFGWLTSGAPYLLVDWLAVATADRYDQWDTNKLLAGIGVFGLFWGLETLAVGRAYGWWPFAALFLVSLPVTATVALLVARESSRTLEALRAVLLFRRRQGLQDYLQSRRGEIEEHLLALIRRARMPALGPTDDRPLPERS